MNITGRLNSYILDCDPKPLIPQGSGSG